ncbi:MAG: hypothetical protein J6S82_02870 [Bacteroidales bacterium]|nr:hypothetical protein [Bacteroidales bacterium]
MKKLSIVLIAAACLLGACKKEDQKEKVTLGATIEAVNSNQKAYIDGSNYVCFAQNDVVKVNGEDIRITSDGRTGSISVTRANNYKAVYPKSILNSQATVTGTTNVQVVLPAEQTYVEKSMGGTLRQVVDMPMAGYLGSSDGTIQFRNLCSVLRIIIHNNKSISLGVKRITVRSSDVPVCGSGVINDITSSTAQINMNSTNTAVQREVSLQMTTPVAVASNTNKAFYIVIPAIPSTNTTNKFTVEVIADSTANNIAYANRYSKTQGSTATGYIARNKLGSAAFHLNANTPPDRPYLILDCPNTNISERIVFAPGNLQYRASDQTWRFAPNTYDFVDGVDIRWSNANNGWTFTWEGASSMTANNYPKNSTRIYTGSSYAMYSGRGSQTGWIDLFGWGTSGKVTGLTDKFATCNEPIAIENNSWGGVNYNPYYGPTSGNLTGTNYDWGTNSIYNPKTGNEETGWVTLSKEEWDCLIASDAFYGYACLSDRSYVQTKQDGSPTRYLSGIVLIPNGFIDPKCASTNNGEFLTSSKYGRNQQGFFTQNMYTTTSWARMEAAGAVFLPTAGYRGGFSVADASSTLHGGVVAMYWTASRYDNSQAYMFRTENGDLQDHTRVRTQESGRSAGCSVRLAKRVQ